MTVVGGDAVEVLDAATRQVLQRLDIPRIMAAALSPLGTYLVTFQRPSKDDSGAGGRGGGYAAGGSSREVGCSIRLSVPLYKALNAFMVCKCPKFVSQDSPSVSLLPPPLLPQPTAT